MLSKSLQQNIKKLKETFHGSEDLVIREFVSFGKVPSAIAYIDGSVDKQFLITGIVAPLQQYKKTGDEPIADFSAKRIISFAQVKVEPDIPSILSDLTSGFCIVLFDKSSSAVSVDSTRWTIRLPNEPPTSAVIMGPREGFVEDLTTNVSLLRKRLKTPQAVFEKFEIGKYTKTEVRICYIHGIVDPQIVTKIKEKLKKIDIDGIVDSSYLRSFLEERKHSLFREVGAAEKADIITAKVLEGRVAILVDGSPAVLTLPFLFIEDFQSSNDYYSAPLRATFLRWIRLLSAIIAVILPGCYVAVMLYHYKLIPIKLLISIANNIQGIPFSPFLEIIFIIFLFEVLYEASLRMPRYLGLALSVVGALILGETAIKAGLVSPPAVMIVALTGVMSYTIPSQTSQISCLRTIFTILGGVLGFYGIIIGSLFLLGYLASMQNYGAPYLAPIGPYIKDDQKDALFKKPIGEMTTRPKSFPNAKKRRLKK